MITRKNLESTGIHSLKQACRISCDHISASTFYKRLTRLEYAKMKRDLISNTEEEHPELVVELEGKVSETNSEGNVIKIPGHVSPTYTTRHSQVKKNKNFKIKLPALKWKSRKNLKITKNSDESKKLLRYFNDCTKSETTFKSNYSDEFPEINGSPADELVIFRTDLNKPTLMGRKQRIPINYPKIDENFIPDSKSQFYNCSLATGRGIIKIPEIKLVKIDQDAKIETQILAPICKQKLSWNMENNLPIAYVDMTKNNPAYFADERKPTITFENLMELQNYWSDIKPASREMDNFEWNYEAGQKINENEVGNSITISKSKKVKFRDIAKDAPNIRTRSKDNIKNTSRIILKCDATTQHISNYSFTLFEPKPNLRQLLITITKNETEQTPTELIELEITKNEIFQVRCVN